MTTVGQYINIIDDSFDIYIILPEWWDDLSVEEVSDIETKIEECSETWRKRNAFSPLDVKMMLKNCLDDEFNILIFDNYTNRGVM